MLSFVRIEVNLYILRVNRIEQQLQDFGESCRRKLVNPCQKMLSHKFSIILPHVVLSQRWIACQQVVIDEIHQILSSHHLSKFRNANWPGNVKSLLYKGWCDG